MVVTCCNLGHLHNCCHMSEVNCVPLLDVTVAGMPKQGTQLERKATVRCVQVVANMSFSGMASNHLVV